MRTYVRKEDNKKDTLRILGCLKIKKHISLKFLMEILAYEYGVKIFVGKISIILFYRSFSCNSTLKISSQGI